MNKNTQNVMRFCALLAMLITVTPASAKSLGGVLQSIGDTASEVVNSIDVKQLAAQPQRDLLTLALGGVVGFAVGGLLANMGIVNIQILGVSVIPIVSGVVGFYLANEGYFDVAKDTIVGTQ